MKYLLTLVVVCATTTFTTAQSVKVTQCVIENGVLKNITADYSQTTGDYSVTVNGVQKLLDEVYPETSHDYAGSTNWFINSLNITVNGNSYAKYGLPRILGTNEIKKVTQYQGVGVYIEWAEKEISEVIYIPSRRGCEFQPYQKQLKAPGLNKLYYDNDWKVTTKDYAAYYRLVTLDATGKPKGLVKDFYITGEKQWEGYLLEMDPYDNNKDIANGLGTWYHKNGKKASQITMVNGKADGIGKTWSEDGRLIEEATYKNGLFHGNVKTYEPGGKVKIVHYTNGVADKN
jgi:antitoxin component YwqK of YwqJK toxin-antitoxin module